MYSNYGITTNTKVKIKNITKLLVEAYEQEQENTLWEMWLSKFPDMTMENYISFNDYKNKSISKKHTSISYEEIEKEMERVEQAFLSK